MKEAQALTVHRAMIDYLGADSEELRGEVWTCLHQCWNGLQDGQGSGDEKHWVMNDGREIPMTAEAEGASVTDRANQLVGDMAGNLASDTLNSVAEERGGASVALRSLCRSLYLAVNFDEEEEEEEWAGPEME